MRVARGILAFAYSAAIARCRGATGGIELLFDIFGVVNWLTLDLDFDRGISVEGVELLRFSFGHESCLLELCHIFEGPRDPQRCFHVYAHGWTGHIRSLSRFINHQGG